MKREKKEERKKRVIGQGGGDILRDWQKKNHSSFSGKKRDCKRKGEGTHCHENVILSRCVPPPKVEGIKNAGEERTGREKRKFA